jgi:hypothetical protein
MTPVRPVFNDGAILGADDLNALAAIDRGRDARHARHLHTPGIGAGLAFSLEERDRNNVPYKEVGLEPGFAVDGTGRELVVSERLPVSPERFRGDVPNPAKVPGDPDLTLWHPVFIRGADTTSVASANGLSGCQAAGGPDRVTEDVEIEFGRPGDADADQAVPAPDEGPGTGAWRVLVGFVQMSTAFAGTGEFVGAEPIADGVRRPYAGVRAGLIAGYDGHLEIRSRPAPDAGVPAVLLDDAQGGSLVFGLHNGSGAVDERMTVDAAGNLTVKGTVSGMLQSGEILVVAGTAFDGTVVPLPSGIDAADVASGAVEVAVHVTPRLPELAAAPSGKLFLPVECRIDDDRRVHCQGTWFDPGSTPLEDRGAACDYVLIVSVLEGGAP